MARGLQQLRMMTRADFGYDLNAGGYKWSNKHRGYPKQIEDALADPEWIAAAEMAESTNLCDELTARDKRQRDAQDVAEREWSGKSRACPNCQTGFTSVQNKGQCPNCRHMFHASHPEGGNDMWWLAIA
jgi:rubrerythrin